VQGGLFTPTTGCLSWRAPPRMRSAPMRWPSPAIPVPGDTEGSYLRWLTDTIRAAEKLEMPPVVAHVYPRNTDKQIILTLEEIAWAVR
jgi:hypothetical protein